MFLTGNYMDVTRSMVDSCRIHFQQIFTAQCDLGIQLLLLFLVLSNLQTQRSTVKILLCCAGVVCFLVIREFWSFMLTST